MMMCISVAAKLGNCLLESLTEIFGNIVTDRCLSGNTVTARCQDVLLSASI